MEKSVYNPRAMEVSGRKKTKVKELTNKLTGDFGLIGGFVHTIRAVGKKMAFVVIREGYYTVQCFLRVGNVGNELVIPDMVNFVNGLSRESIVDVEGIVCVPPSEIVGATQQVEIQVTKIYCLHRAPVSLALSVEDASRSEAEIEKGGFPRVNQDTRLNNRVLDLRTPANKAIFRIQHQIARLFRQFLESETEDFLELHSPPLLEGSSEGGADVFVLDYFGRQACLAQSPQLYKQMAICAGQQRVFEIGPVFRAEKSYTHRHLTVFTGLDVEMEINENYSEVMDIVDRLFVEMFDKLYETCSEELEAINKQYPFKKIEYLQKTLRLTFEEGVQMLKEEGVEIDPFGDLNTEAERTLGQLVRKKYGTDFYILHRFPLAVRPFYTMPCHDNEKYSNSFDVFLRGEEIISGSERIHVAELLTERAQAAGIDVKTIETYIDSFRNGAPRHGGFGAGLERVVMLFCGLDNIRKTSMFPCDPKRLGVSNGLANRKTE